MRFVITPSLTLIVAGLLVLPTLAQPPEGKGKGGDRPRSREEMREHFKARILNAFDKDGDGKLSDEERENMPEAARERAKQVLDGAGGQKGDKAEKKKAGRKKDGDRKGAKRKRDGRGPGGRGPGGGPHGDRRRMEAHRVRHMHGGPGGPDGEMRKLIADALFRKFDADGDEKLSRDEFNKLGQFVHEHVPHRGPHGGPGMMRGHEQDGPGPDRGRAVMYRRGPRPDGPPRGEGPRGDRGAHRDGPPGGDGPPPFERRMRRPDGDGPRDFERGDRGGRGDRGDRRPGDDDGPRHGPGPDGPRPDGPPPGPPGSPPGTEDKPGDAV